MQPEYMLKAWYTNKDKFRVIITSLLDKICINVVLSFNVRSGKY